MLPEACRTPYLRCVRVASCSDERLVCCRDAIGYAIRPTPPELVPHLRYCRLPDGLKQRRTWKARHVGGLLSFFVCVFLSLVKLLMRLAIAVCYSKERNLLRRHERIRLQVYFARESAGL